MQPNLDDINKKIEENRDFISRIAAGIPGFKGYVERAEKYDADKMVREIITGKMQSLKKQLGIISSDLVKKSELDLVQGLDALSNLVEGVMKKVEYADYGLSGAFSKIKFTEEGQNRLLEFDWRLISKFEEIEKLVDQTAETTAETIDQLKGVVRNFEKDFDDRKNVIMEVI